MSGYRCLHREQVLFRDGEDGNHDDNKNDDDDNDNNDNDDNDNDTDDVFCIWNVQTTPLLLSPTSLQRKRRSSNTNCYRIWLACSDGYARTCVIQEKNASSSSAGAVAGAAAPFLLLDASACTVRCTHRLVGRRQTTTMSTTTTTTTRTTTTRTKKVPILGCTKITTVRNYTGDDTDVGDVVIVTIDMAGMIRVYNIPEDFDNNNDNDDPNDDPTNNNNTSTKSSSTPANSTTDDITPVHEFTVPNATGTTAVLLKPSSTLGYFVDKNNNHNNNDSISSISNSIIVAVGCLDGTIALVSTGIVVVAPAVSIRHDNKMVEPLPPGTILETLGRSGSSIPLCITYNDITSSFAIGRQDGTIDIIPIISSSSSTSKQQQQHQHHYHRLTQLVNAPVRAVSYTPDGHLLIGGNDHGIICIWDISRPNHNAPALVHHVLPSPHTNNNNNTDNSNWILDLIALNDSRRFVTISTDKTIKVWQIGTQLQSGPIHTFQSDHFVWTICSSGATTTTNNNNGSAQQQQQQRLITGSDNGGWIQIFSVE